MKKIINVAVLGSSGYVGNELVNLLSKHTNVKINFLGSDTYENEYLINYKSNEKFTNLPLLKKNTSFDPSVSDCVFLALPHSISNIYVKKFYDKIKIIDLSADFRLESLEIYEKYYGDNHSCSEYLSEFIYGLVEINRSKIAKSNYIAVPGCYATSILLPLIPLFKKNMINSNDIIIDSKSGYSGAGKNYDIENIKKASDYNLFNYNTNTHRHIPEIRQELLKSLSINNLNFSFNPHILPNFRGIMSTIYCNLENKTTKKNIIDNFKEFEKINPFIDFVNDNTRLDLFSIQNTNYCKIKLFDHYNEKKLIIVSVIDNLIKGAAGQAIQCFNLMENFDETQSLI